MKHEESATKLQCLSYLIWTLCCIKYFIAYNKEDPKVISLRFSCLNVVNLLSEFESRFIIDKSSKTFLKMSINCIKTLIRKTYILEPIEKSKLSKISFYNVAS